jgi:hypothetical protein
MKSVFAKTDGIFPLEKSSVAMDVQSIYAARTLPRAELPQSILDTISRLKLSFKPLYRKPYQAPTHRRPKEETSNWRETVLVEMVRKVREKDDPEYDTVSSAINKLSKQNSAKLTAEVLTLIGKRDGLFRLRVTTLLFDRSIRQPFFAPLLADLYRDIVKACPDAAGDLSIQLQMVDVLYDTGNVTMIPSTDDPTYGDAVIAWTKQKELKRGFAVYLAELYSRGLVPQETMTQYVTSMLEDLQESVRAPKSGVKEEHVDALVRFVFAVSSKVDIRTQVRALLALPRTETPNLIMKSRFSLEDSLKKFV